jgi:hypothetical protein
MVGMSASGMLGEFGVMTVPEAEAMGMPMLESASATSAAEDAGVGMETPRAVPRLSLSFLDSREHVAGSHAVGTSEVGAVSLEAAASSD